jgi:hypothetical protein
MGSTTVLRSFSSGGSQVTSKWPAHRDEGPFSSTSHHQRFSGPVMAMWLGTMSKTCPSPASRIAATSRPCASAPPSSSLTREWSTTSYPCVDPGAACNTGDRYTWDTPSAARYPTTPAAASNPNPGPNCSRYVARGASVTQAARRG